MSRMTRSRRLLSTAVASLTALALVAGCGGSDVTEASAQAPEAVAQTATGTGTSSTDAGATIDTTVPAAGDTAGAGTAGSGTTAAGTTDTTATTAATGTAGTGTVGKSGTAGKGATGTAGGAVAAVEAMVANSPILGGKAACKPATLSEVNIGNVSTLSGVLGELFAPSRSALEIFVASQNACGGLNGHKIRFFQADDQGDPSTAASLAANMISKNKVLAFVGNIQVLTIDGALPVYKKYNIPVIGNDGVNNTWFSNPILFPQGSNHLAMSYGYLQGLVKYHGTKTLGDVYCIEVPRACEQINKAMVEMAPAMGAVVKKEIQTTITAPSYVQECLAMQSAGVDGLALSIDAASMNRFARSCLQVGYQPKLVSFPLAVGNEKQFLQGNKWLGNTYVPYNVSPWMANTTPAQKYWQASAAKYSPGFTSGGAASLGWAAGALLVAASANLSATNPTTQQLYDSLWQFRGQKFTELGGLSGPKFFAKDKWPRVPYCLFYIVSNADATGWKEHAATPTCSDAIAPSDVMNLKDKVA